MTKSSRSKKTAPARYEEAADWLLNRADMNTQTLFWAYVDGVIMYDELDTLDWQQVEERRADLKAQGRVR